MKKVTYKIEQFKSITVEVETAEQERQIEVLNRDFERTDRQDRRIKAKTDSLDQMYEESGYEVADEGATPEEQMLHADEQNELKELIHKAIKKLNPRQQEMVFMIFFEEKTQAEVAEHYGITESAVSQAMDRIYASLKKFFEKK